MYLVKTPRNLGFVWKIVDNIIYIAMFLRPQPKLAIKPKK